jgi:hypothetical protein
MGVVSGLVMSFEFGTNFSRFAQAVGPVIGPIIGLEVMSAFFLEAGFLRIMLFGWGRVGRKLHFAASGTGTHHEQSGCRLALAARRPDQTLRIYAGMRGTTKWKSLSVEPAAA